MAAEVSGKRGGFEHEAFICHAAGDLAWARRLQADLADYGIDGAMVAFSMAEEGEMWGRAIDHLLASTRALIVLWTPKSVGAASVELEIRTFEQQVQNASKDPPLLIPVFFDKDLISTAPAPLRSRQGALLNSKIYELGPNRSAPGWDNAVREIVLALSTSPVGDIGLGKPVQSTLGLDSPQVALRRARVTLDDGGGGQTGWLLGDDLAIVRTSGMTPTPEVTVQTAFGEAHAIVGSWRDWLDDLFVFLAPLRLDPLLKLTQPLPIDTPAQGRLVEIWGWPLTHAIARAVVGEPKPDGTFLLPISSNMVDLHSSRERSENARRKADGSLDPPPIDGVIENGAAVWDPERSRFVGVVACTSGGHWLLVPVSTLRELAGKAPRSAATTPPSARLHDDSWTTEDRLDYALYARAVKEFIEHPDTSPPLVIGVQGPWGQGKTSLMRIAQKRLDPGHPDFAPPPAGGTSDGSSAVSFRDLRDSLDGDVPLGDVQASEIRSVWFNPWKYQSSEALWAGLAHSILTQLPARLSRIERERFWLALQRRRIDALAVRRDIHRLVLERLLPWLIASMTVAIVVAVALATAGESAVVSALGSVTTGAVIAVASATATRRKTLERKLEGSYLRYVSQPDYAGKLGYLHHVEEDMRKALDLLAPDGAPVVVFIDDLDRCSAPRIAEVLEAINLFLSGEYPNCVFVLGVDAQIVASAMETVHRQALGDEGEGRDRARGALGWRFLEKFIQLSFVMPRLSDPQREAYLMSLLRRASSPPEAGRASETLADAERIRHELASGELSAEDAAQRVGKLIHPVALESSEVRRVAEDVIALGARDFSDAGEETIAVLSQQLPHLSDNPRTIKRAVNLYRFYRFLAWAREASGTDVATATPELIASWSVVAARWPQAVHWLQVNGRESADPEKLLRETWQKQEPGLCSFLDTDEALDLSRAMACGLW